MQKVETLGERLRRLRLEANLTPQQVAKALGVAATTYREWENGRSIRGEPYLKLAKVRKRSIGPSLSKMKSIC